jgi:hypothetical protein
VRFPHRSKSEIGVPDAHGYSEPISALEVFFASRPRAAHDSRFDQREFFDAVLEALGSRVTAGHGHLPHIARHSIKPIFISAAPASRLEIVLPPVKATIAVGIIICLLAWMVTSPRIRLVPEPAAGCILELDARGQAAETL